MPTTGSTGISKSSHSSRPIYLSISVSIVDSRSSPREVPTGATVAPIPIPIVCKVRQFIRRLRQTFFHTQLTGVNLALIPDRKHFLEACVCSDKTIQLRALCLHVRCIRDPHFASLQWHDTSPPISENQPTVPGRSRQRSENDQTGRCREYRPV
jgi:hypothetical protein